MKPLTLKDLKPVVFIPYQKMATVFDWKPSTPGLHRPK